jgi:hypothetical protein
MLKNWDFDGIDLDIEEDMRLQDVQYLIRQLKEDFGPDFIITMAPVYSAMIEKRAKVNYVDVNQYWPGTRETNCTKRILANDKNLMERQKFEKRNLSGFDYVKLRDSAEGRLVDWYNVQVYNEWGTLKERGLFDKIIKNGWHPSQIVLGSLTHVCHGSGFVQPAHYERELREIMEEYPDFGGMMGWELYQPDGNHYGWAEIMNFFYEGGLPTKYTKKHFKGSRQIARNVQGTVYKRDDNSTTEQCKLGAAAAQ